MRKGTKKKNSKIQKYMQHARDRAKERLNIELSDTDIITITKMIQTSQSKFIHDYSNYYSCHEVTYKGKQLRVVYDKHQKIVSTVLPEEASGDKVA